MENQKPILTEENLITKVMWSSRSLYKAISGVAVAVFVITMIYAQFLSMAKDIEFMKITHASEIIVLTERLDTQNKRLVAEDKKGEEERDENAKELMLLKLDAHEPAPGQKRIHR